MKSDIEAVAKDSAQAEPAAAPDIIDLQGEALKNSSPQDVQQQFTHHTELMDDLVNVNRDLIAYASELGKLVRGSNTSGRL